MNKDNIDKKPKIKDQSQAQNKKTTNPQSKLEIRYRAFYLSLDTIRFLESLPKKQSLRIISEQLIRCITSIGANIVEARRSSSKKEFARFLQIALKSANEAEYWLASLKELLQNEEEEINKFIKEVNEISKILGSSILTMKGKRKL